MVFCLSSITIIIKREQGKFITTISSIWVVMIRKNYSAMTIFVLVKKVAKWLKFTLGTTSCIKCNLWLYYRHGCDNNNKGEKIVGIGHIVNCLDRKQKHL
jgi:hypothetical protein